MSPERAGGRKPDRRRALLFVLLAAAVVAVPGRLAWSMRASTLSNAAGVREQARRLNEQVAQARRDQARSADLNDQLQALAAAMPADADLPSVVEQLGALAREANVSFVATAQTPPATPRTDAAGATATTTTTVAPKAADAPVEGDAPSTVTSATVSFVLEVDVVGTATNLTAYLEKIRSLPRVLTIERLTWSWQEGVTGGANTQSVNAHFAIRAFSWSSAPRQLAGPVAGGPTATTAKAP